MPEVATAMALAVVSTTWVNKACRQLRAISEGTDWANQRRGTMPSLADRSISFMPLWNGGAEHHTIIGRPYKPNMSY